MCILADVLHMVRHVKQYSCGSHRQEGWVGQQHALHPFMGFVVQLEDVLLGN